MISYCAVLDACAEDFNDIASETSGNRVLLLVVCAKRLLGFTGTRCDKFKAAPNLSQHSAVGGGVSTSTERSALYLWVTPHLTGVIWGSCIVRRISCGATSCRRRSGAGRSLNWDDVHGCNLGPGVLQGGTVVVILISVCGSTGDIDGGHHVHSLR
jgi:hypothetical protein